MSTAMTQMNTRLEAQLKDSGDQALSLANRTPSQAVRWLWEYLSIHKNDPDALRFLDGDPADAHIEAGLSVDRDKVSSLHTLVDDIRAFEGQHAPWGEYGEVSSRELLADALHDRFRERGLA